MNIGSEEMVTINEFTEKMVALSGKPLHIRNIDGPVGVNGRNSDNARMRTICGWHPRVSLEEGMDRLYAWVESECAKVSAEGVATGS